MIFTRCVQKTDVEGSEFLVVNLVHIFTLFILNIIPEAGLCK